MEPLRSPQHWNRQFIIESPNDYPTLSDGALIERCRRGDEPAWAALLERYGGLIYSIALNCHLTPEEVADVFQSVCLMMLDELDTLKDESKLSSWLTTITLWQCRQLADPEPVGEDLTRSLQAALLPTETIQQMEREQLLQQALSMMEEPSRRLLLSLFYEKEPWSDETIPRGTDLSAPAIPLDGCLKSFIGVLTELGFSAQI